MNNEIRISLVRKVFESSNSFEKILIIVVTIAALAGIVSQNTVKRKLPYLCAQMNLYFKSFK